MFENDLKPAQKNALELLTSGLALNYSEIAERCGVSASTLLNWRKNDITFKEKLTELNDARWMAAEDAARQACIELCKDKNEKMVEFVLKNAGYNPAQKQEIEVANGITINIEE